MLQGEHLLVCSVQLFSSLFNFCFQFCIPLVNFQQSLTSVINRRVYSVKLGFILFQTFKEAQYYQPLSFEIQPIITYIVIIVNSIYKFLYFLHVYFPSWEPAPCLIYVFNAFFIQNSEFFSSWIYNFLVKSDIISS